MTIISEAETDQVVPFHQGAPAAQWFVVGFDGTPPSRAALDAAARLVRDRGGHLEVVFVGHLPAYAAMSADAILGIREGFPGIASALIEELRPVLDRGEVDWHFQQRDGSVPTELLAAATELRERHGVEANIVIIVGSSQHRLHRATRSAAGWLMNESEFPLLVVPQVKAGVTAADSDHRRAIHQAG